MTDFLILAGGLVNIAGIIPYIAAVIRGKTKPRIVSWFTWGLLTAIASAASFSDHQYASAVLALSAVIINASVVSLGWRYGDRKFERFDLVCQTGALAGLTAWFVFGSPALAILFTISVDFIGALPTIRHCWQKPYEETWISFITASTSGLLALAAASGWKVTAIGYPVYIMTMNAIFAVVVLSRRKYAVKGEPAELREL